MSLNMTWVEDHKVAIVIIGGVGIGLLLLFKSGSSSSAGSTTSTGASSPTGTYTSTLPSSYQYALAAQSLSNQAQAQSAATVAATQIGLAQQKTAQKTAGLTALTYTAMGIDSTLMNQNNNQAGLYANNANAMTGLNMSGMSKLNSAVIGSNQLSQSILSGRFSGFGMNIGGGAAAGAAPVNGA